MRVRYWVVAVLVLVMLPVLGRLAASRINRWLLARYGPTFPHDVVETVLHILHGLWVIGLAVAGVVLLAASPPPGSTSGSIAQGSGPLGISISFLEQLERSLPGRGAYFLSVRVLGAFTLLFALAAGAVMLWDRLGTIGRLIATRVEQHLHMVMLLLVAFLSGLILLVNHRMVFSPAPWLADSALTTADREIEIYRPTYWSVQARHRWNLPVAIPAAAPEKETPSWLTDSELEDLKSLVPDLEQLYASQSVLARWGDKTIRVVEATAGYFPTRNRDLVAGDLPQHGDEGLINTAMLASAESIHEEASWLGKQISVQVAGFVRHLTVVGIVRDLQPARDPTVYLRAAPGTRWTSAVGVVKGDKNPAAVAAALQSALDSLYGPDAWRAESRRAQNQQWLAARDRVRWANRWIGLMSLLLAGTTVFGLAFTGERKSMARHALARALGQGRGPLLVGRVARYTLLGMSGGFFGALAGQLLFPWFSLGPSPFSSPISERPGPEALLWATVAVGAATFAGSLWPVWHAANANIAQVLRLIEVAGGGGELAPTRFPPRVRRLLTPGAGLSVMQMALSIGLLISVVSTDDALRRELASAGLSRYLLVYPASSGGTPLGWGRDDLDSLRSSLSGAIHLLALSDGGEAYVRSSPGDRTYSALARSGTEELPAIYGWRLQAGSMLSAVDVRQEAPVAVIARDLGEVLWGKADPTTYLGKQFYFRPAYAAGTSWQPVRVIGVMSAPVEGLGGPVGDLPAFFVPLGVLPGPRLPGGTPLGRFVVARPAGESKTDPGSVLARLAAAYLRPTYGLVDYREQTPREDLLLGLDREGRILSWELLFVLLTAGTGMFAFRWLDVSSHTRYLGMRRTLGSGRLPLLLDVWADSGLVLLLASVAGLLAAAVWAPRLTRPLLVVQVFLSMETAGLPVWTLRGVLIGVIIPLVTAGLLSSYPAWVAARTSPLEAVREGARL